MRRLRLGRLVVPEDLDDPRGRADWDDPDPDELEGDASGWMFDRSTTRDLRRGLAWESYYRAEAPELHNAGRYRAMLEELARRAPLPSPRRA